MANAKVTKNKFRVLRKPIFTEKSTYAGGATNTVAFEVHPRATKTEIKNAVEKLFDVQVEAVRTMNTLGKVKRVGVSTGRQKARKKAYVSLAAGSSIDLVEGL